MQGLKIEIMATDTNYHAQAEVIQLKEQSTYPVQKCLVGILELYPTIKYFVLIKYVNPIFINEQNSQLTVIEILYWFSILMEQSKHLGLGWI